MQTSTDGHGGRSAGWDGPVSDLSAVLDLHITGPGFVGTYTEKSTGPSDSAKILALAPLFRDLRKLVGPGLTLNRTTLEAALKQSAMEKRSGEGRSRRAPEGKYNM